MSITNDQERLRKIAQKAADEWWKKNGTEEAIQEAVWEKLEATKQEVITAFLGFERDSWTKRLRLDSVFGRPSPETEAGMFLRTKCREFVQKWLEENLTNISLSFSEKDKKDIAKYTKKLSLILLQV